MAAAWRACNRILATHATVNTSSGEGGERRVRGGGGGNVYPLSPFPLHFPSTLPPPPPLTLRSPPSPLLVFTVACVANMRLQARHAAATRGGSTAVVWHVWGDYLHKMWR